MQRKKASDFPKELLDLFDRYVHGMVDRRYFVKEAAKYAVGGLTVAAILDGLSPNYAWAQQVSPDDPDLSLDFVEYDSPKGHGRMRGYLARLASAERALPGVIVVHENRGLNPYIEDVTRRLGKAGFLAFAPDALTPLGGYPGNDDEGRELQRQLERETIAEDFAAAAEFLAAHGECDGVVGVIGFCFGGWMSNRLAWRLPDLIKASVPYYGGQAPAEEASKIKASLQLHYAEHDERVNAGWPVYEEALKANGVEYEVYFYEGAHHGFHNDTTPRYDEEAAKLAWQRSVDFLNRVLKGRG